MEIIYFLMGVGAVAAAISIWGIIEILRHPESSVL